jgi:hypothetical protein
MFWNRGLYVMPILVACGSVGSTPAEVDASLDSPAPTPDGPVAMPDGPAAPRIVAANTVSRTDLAPGIQPLVVPAGKTYVFDTEQGAVFDASNGNAPLRVAGDGVKDGIFYRSDDKNRAFFAVQSLTVGQNAILRGVGGRALILIADGRIEIRGLIDVSAGRCSITATGLACPGPGGGRGGENANAALGCSPGQRGGGFTGQASGSGGGGFASPGGSGGASSTATNAVAGGPGGSGQGCAGITLDPIQGGSGGNNGGLGGGGGGGAVQITSYTSIDFFTPNTPNTCGVAAGGGGGGGGMPGGSGPLAGSGGGSGGAILLDATAIAIGPGVVLAANGGGGGAGAQMTNGQSGQLGSTPAMGGAAVTGAAGGAGAALNATAGDGAPGVSSTASSPSGGGGGGGAGRIRINAVTLTNLSDQAVVSPAPSINVPAATE